MHIKSLKVFCDIVAEKSFSRAALDNGITQSGASQVVHQLEERLGVKLIDRSTRPWALTTEGEIYHRGVRQFLRNYSALEDEIRNLCHAISGNVRVASIYSIGLSHLHHYVADFMTRYPRAKVRVQYQHPDAVYELVQCDEVDLGLVSFPKSSRTVEVVNWRTEPMVFVCAPHHPLAAEAEVSPAQLNRLDWIGFDRGLRIRREVDRWLSSWGVEVNIVNEFDNLETIKRAIEINVGAAILPQPTVVREIRLGSLVGLPITINSEGHVPYVRPLGIIYRRGRTQSPTVARFINELRHLQVAVETTGRLPTDPLVSLSDGNAVERA